ncbi:MAG TPA: SpoIID/LytB domain-containing protein [Wenzhouxiangella sp.]|nr:SpoIID/LytB domain-containing protein [Wenzhouxiangella sp.]
MTRIAALPALAICVLASVPAPAAQIAARDALTGAPVQAILKLDHDTGRTARIDGRLRAVELPDHVTTITAQAAGYRSLEFHAKKNDQPMTLLLDPLERPEKFARLETQIAGTEARALQGYIRHAESGRAVAGVRVEFEGTDTVSDAEGYFQLFLQPCEASGTERSTLRVQAGAQGELTIDNILCSPGIERRILAVGENITERTSDTVGAVDNGNSGGHVPRPPAHSAPLVEPLMSPLEDAGAIQLAAGIQPPASIRIGFADAACTQECCTGSCGHTCIKSLETYVRNGLHREWIASWNPGSLRAGSVAYRSYGAWHVDNPRSANYDICSSACCQVNGHTTHSSTDSATARTAGVMLSRDGATPFRAEYSADNNSWVDPNSSLSCSNSDLSCGDGFAGSPAADWPCLNDPVSLGQSCFGHGRGMSQWGTQRWATQPDAPLWTWIVDHYYNDNGSGSGLRTATMTSPVELSAGAATPSTAAPGTAVELSALANNMSTTEHAHLLIGASLYRSGTGYIDDSANDKPFALPSGTHSVGRPFEIPATASPGSYDVLISLYLDVDENGQITAHDLPLALLNIPQALQVLDGNGDEDADIFEDRFEPQTITP